MRRKRRIDHEQEVVEKTVRLRNYTEEEEER